MTAQSLTSSSTTESFQPLQHKADQDRCRRETEAVPIPQQQQEEEEEQQQQQQQQALDLSVAAAGLARPQAWGEANSVEPDSQDDHRRQQQHAMVIVADDTAAGAASRGGAIPMSPPSSPTHATADAQEVMTAAVVATRPSASSPPSPLLLASFHEKEGGDEEAIEAVAARDAPLSSVAPAVPVRLGRGRKLCPNCNSLAKSAVKQCRICHHVFSPASRMRHSEPKENVETPTLPRRRHRPSQRLLESLVESDGPQVAAASAGIEGAARASSASARPPLVASNTGGDVNQQLVSGEVGEGRPVTANDVIAMTTKKTVSGAAGSGDQTPKRSHKRKVPLPRGVATPKRRKGAAAADVRLVTAAEAPNETNRTDAGTGPHGILTRLSLPEKQRVAEGLLASPTPSRVVPESPELSPMASPAGPLLFITPSSASPSSNAPSSFDDDPEWLTDATVVSPAATFVHQHQLQQQQQQLFRADTETTSLTGLLLEEDQDEEEFPMRRLDIGVGGAHLDLSAESQGKDPFAGVEVAWWDYGEAAGSNPSGGVPTSSPMVGRDGTVEQHFVFPSSQSTELLGDADDAFLWNPLRASSSRECGVVATAGAVAASGRSLTLWPGSSDNDNRLLVAAASFGGRVSRSSSSSPSYGRLTLPSFERGAAVASSFGAAAATAATTRDSWTGAGAGVTGVASHVMTPPEFLLAEASCSSLPEPLVFGGGGTTSAVAAVSTDSGDGDGGRFWSPFQGCGSSAGSFPHSVTS